jgi:ribosome-binding factor A
MGKQRSHRQRSDGEQAHVRHVRLGELIREEIGFLLDTEIEDRRLEGARVTAVELARDGSRARIWFALRDPSVPEEVGERAMQGARGFLRARLCEALSLKRVPELSFRLDPGAGACESGEND